MLIISNHYNNVWTVWDIWFFYIAQNVEKLRHDFRKKWVHFKNEVN